MEIQVEVPSIIKFCENCQNMLGVTFEGRTLVYKCGKPKCGFQLRVSCRDRNQNLVSKREFLSKKSLLVRSEFSLDPTMPRKRTICPSCSFSEAVFLISTDVEDTRVEVIFICANKLCGHIWKNEPLE